MKFTHLISNKGYYHELLLINLNQEEFDDVMEKLELELELNGDRGEKILRAHDVKPGCRGSYHCKQGACSSWDHCVSRRRP